MEMPEGWNDLHKYSEAMIFTQRIYGKSRKDDIDKQIDLKFAVNLMKEMAEALEEIEMWAPKIYENPPWKSPLKKWREWK